MRIVFFGTPEFAVPSLRALLEEGFEVCAVVTQPDKPRKRSRSRLMAPPIKELAIEYGLAVVQPENPSDATFLQQLQEHRPDLGVVVAYGHILRKALLELMPLGFLNMHASLLPKLRGAAPIQHAIIQGLDETGVSIMRIDEGLDTGPVLMTIPTPIAADETGGELRERLAELGALAIIEATSLLALGKLSFQPQNHEDATHAPKIDSDSARIDWTKDAAMVARLVRALDPEPGSWSQVNDRRVQFFGPAEVDGDGLPGLVLALEPTITVATGAGALQFLDVKPSGSRRMPATDWIRGRAINVGDSFT